MKTWHDCVRKNGDLKWTQYGSITRTYETIHTRVAVPDGNGFTARVHTNTSVSTARKVSDHGAWGDFTCALCLGQIEILNKSVFAMYYCFRKDVNAFLFSEIFYFLKIIFYIQYFIFWYFYFLKKYFLRKNISQNYNKVLSRSLVNSKNVSFPATSPRITGLSALSPDSKTISTVPVSFPL